MNNDASPALPRALRGAVAAVLVAAAGIAIGCAAGLLLTRLLGSMLNDVNPADPAVFAGNAALVLLVSVAACYLPARWAGRVDPAVVLRNE